MSEHSIAIITLETIVGHKLTPDLRKKVMAMPAKEARDYADRQWARFMKQPVSIQVGMEDLYDVIIAFEGQSILLKNNRENCIPGSRGFEEYNDSLKKSETNIAYWIGICDSARNSNPLVLEEIE